MATPLCRPPRHTTRTKCDAMPRHAQHAKHAHTSTTHVVGLQTTVHHKAHHTALLESCGHGRENKWPHRCAARHATPHGPSVMHSGLEAHSWILDVCACCAWRRVIVTTPSKRWLNVARRQGPVAPDCALLTAHALRRRPAPLMDSRGSLREIIDSSQADGEQPLTGAPLHGAACMAAAGGVAHSLC